MLINNENNSKDIIKKRDFLKSNWNSTNFDISDQNQGKPIPLLQQEFTEQSKIIDLPDYTGIDDKSITVTECIINRKSTRKYSKKQLSLNELSYLLYMTQGVKKVTERYSLRTVPSGGARHPFETYLYIDKIKGIKKGIYRYLALQHKLCCIKQNDNLQQAVDTAMMNQFWQAAAVFIWVCIPYRTEWKYMESSYKTMILDAGHICQNLYLACEAIGCGTCAIAAYDQNKIDEFLNLDGKEEFVLYMAPVGKKMEKSKILE